MKLPLRRAGLTLENVHPSLTDDETLLGVPSELVLEADLAATLSLCPCLCTLRLNFALDCASDSAAADETELLLPDPVETPLLLT